MQRFTIIPTDPRLVVPHDECNGPEQGIQGAFDIMLDTYQVDDLEKNNYTLATETCMYCHQTSSFMLFGDVNGDHDATQDNCPPDIYGGEL